jgi:arylsulfatase A-like enzyme
MNGSHRQHGILILSGPGVRKGVVEAGVSDVAPTLLALSGQAVPAHMDGRVLKEAMAVPSERRERVEFERGEGRGLGDRESEGLRQRLEKLGYL